MEATWILVGVVLAGLVGGLSGAWGATWKLAHEVALMKLQMADHLEKAEHLLGRIRRRARMPQDGFQPEGPMPNTPLTREEVLRRAYERGMAVRGGVRGT